MKTQTRFAYIDFDGVLASFTFHAAQKLNLDISELTKTTIPNYYISNKSKDIESQVDALMSEVSFWSEMPKYEWSADIINIVDKAYGKDWAFLTKGIGHSACFHGKALWLEKHFPEHIKRLIITGSKKHNLCRDDSQLLIDDNKKNCKQWDENLGTYFLWQEITPDWTERAEIQLENLKQFVNIHRYD